MKIRQGTKKILAGFMAMSMILSCGVTNLTEVSAEEADASPLYEVHLNESENGSLHIEGVEEKTLSVQEGELVQIASHPLEGYETETIEVVGEDTGTKVEVSTNENLYQFQMPAENVQVTGIYQAVKAVQGNETLEGAGTVEIGPDKWSEEESAENADTAKTNNKGITPAFAAASRAVGGTRTVTVSDGRYTQDLLRVGYFELDGGTKAFCACHELQPPEAGTVMRNIATYTYANKANELLRKVMYYGWGGPADVGGVSDGDHYRETALAISVANGHDDNFYGYGQAFIDRIRSKSNAPDGFTVYKIGNGTGIQDLAYYSWNPKGTLTLEKESSNPSITNGNSCYSLQGAVYGVYSDEACKKSVGSLTTKADGTSNKLTLNAGTYYIKETKAPTGFALDKEIHKVTISAGKPSTLKVKDTPINDPFTLTLEKIDDGKAVNGAQGNASLAGAQFTVKYYDGYYTKSNLPKEAEKIWVFQTKELENPSTGEILYYLFYNDDYKVSGPELYEINGTETLPLGTITIEETKAPEGYTLDNGTMTSSKGETVTDGVYLAQIKQHGDAGSLDVGNEFTQNESVIRGGVKVQKRDNATGSTVPQGGLSFNGVELKIYNRSENSVIVEGKEYAPGTVVKTLTLDNNGYAETATDLLPYGTYEIVETVPPTGYMNTGVISRTFDIETDGQLVDLTKEETSIRNDLLRGDFEITKINSNTQEAMAGVQFKITHVATGESHMITTDENGFYSSSSDFNKHSQDTNGGKVTSGLWFGDKPVIDDMGAMPYGVYTIEEIEGEANKGMVMYKSTFTITRNNFIVDLGNIENRPITLTTTAKDQDTNNHYSPARNEVTVIDEIFYTGVEPDHEYTVVGTLMNKATGAAVKDANGNEVTAKRTFTPVAQTGIIEMEFIFNSSKMAGMDLVVFEEMYDADGNLVGQHTDLTDEDQSIYVPRITTTAIDTATGEHVGKGQKTTIILDTVAFDNVHPGYEYTLEGVIYDRTTGEPLLDKDGNEITGQTLFTPKADHGNAIVEFTLDTSDLAGKTIVVYQQLIRRGETYAWHEELSSESQAIHFPLIGTKAIDSESGIQNSLADNSITIRDTVKYQNVVPGLTYTMKGTIYDKESGKPLTVNGKAVTAETTFVPNSADGETVVSFTFDGSDLAGKTLVCFEKLFYNNVELTNHDQINAKEQTIYVPEIGTEAKDAENGTQTSMADKDITITDKVSYKNLIPGTTYTVKGQLYDQETGKPMLDDAGHEITAEKDITPTTANGEVEITFTFSGVSLAGKVGVAFEEVYYKDHLVGVHASLEDESQMIFYPEIKTTAAGDRENMVYADKSAKVTDTVAYKGVQPGEEYVLEATLRDQKTGEVLKDKDGNAITGSTTFTPESTSGTVDVILSFDASTLAGTSAVVFEQLKVDGFVVGHHEEVTDTSQHIYIPSISTSALDSDTGIRNSYADDSITVHDTVAYKGMAPGKEYVIKGKLMDKETGEPFLVNEKEVTAKQVFTPEKPDGTVTVTFTFDGTGLENRAFVIYEQAFYKDFLVAQHCDQSDRLQTISIPKIETTATDTENGTHTSNADKEVTVKDVVRYEKLIPGTTYTMEGVLYDKGTQEPLLDGEGNKVTSSVTFTPTAAAGSVEILFTFDGSLLAGKTLVAFETCKYEGKTVAVHADITDRNQTDYLPDLHTKARDTLTGTQFLFAGKDASITDEVFYKGLEPGEEYTLVTTLYDRETGELLFVPESASDEENAGEQEGEADDQQPDAETENAVMEGEVPSEETSEDAAFGEDTSNEEVSGHTVTVETAFTAETSEGTVETIIPFDASQLAGKTIVVFQQLKVDGYLVGSAEDLYDELETIRIPKICTTAIDKDTQDHLTNADDDVTVIDEVAYENLIPGESYTLEAVLMDKETGEPVKARVYKEAAAVGEEPGNTKAPEEEEIVDSEEADQSSSLDEKTSGNEEDTEEIEDAKTEEILSEEAEEVTATVTFTPKEASGTVDVVFHFDGSELAGHTFVVFERAYYTDAFIASHEDIDSEEQTVWVPSLKTVATDKADGDHFVLVPGEQTIVDTVSYTNLIPGKEYRLQMVLMDKETGEPVTIDGKEVTAETTFTPEKADGETTIEVTLNTEGLANKSAVCFEKLFYGDVEIGSHEDITDEDQSVHFIEEAYQTGVTLFGAAALLLGIALAELAALLLLKSRRK